MPRFIATIGRDPTANVETDVVNASVRAQINRNPTANVEADLEIEDL